MKNLLIIYPHWPPSNLAGVHRPRLIANNLHQYGWHPVVLTVSHRFYEEPPDWDLVKAVSRDVEVHYVKAFKIRKPRIIGDIGLRGMNFLNKRAKEIMKRKKIDFVWIPIPSFYTALLGRWLYEKYKIPYGIDYIDPWVRDISGRRNFRSVMSLWLAKILEPVAVKKASLITGVAYDYYKPVLERNFKKKSKPIPDKSIDTTNNTKLESDNSVNRLTDYTIQYLSFPYGFDHNDYKIPPSDATLPWSADVQFPLVYAGAFLPNARLTMEYLFMALKIMKENDELPDGIKLYFIGTGSYIGKSIKQMSEEYGIGQFIEEKRERIPYLKVLHMLKNAFGVMVIGSTEPHYTASKIYQALLSGNPVVALLHRESQAYEVLQETGSDALTISFKDLNEEIIQEIGSKISMLIYGKIYWQPDIDKLKKYSANESSGKLAVKMDEIIKKMPDHKL